MKRPTLAFAAAACILASSAAWAASTRVVVFKGGTTAEQRRNQIEALGGKLLRDYNFVNEALGEFGGRSIESLSTELPGKAPNATAIEDNKTSYWLSGQTYAPFPAVSGMISRARWAAAGEEREIAYAKTSVPGGAGGIPWGVERVNAPAAWKKGLDGTGVKIGVVDTGVDLTHPDLAANIGGGFNALIESAGANDDNGHGTHVAGTVAGAGANNVYGVAPKARIYAAKVLSAHGYGELAGIVSGVNWAIGQRVNVINMSLGNGNEAAALKQAVQYAHDAGIAVVCAAGNSAGPVDYPAAYPGAIAVSASDSGDALTSSSNRGPEIAFIAPGANIYSACMGGAYCEMSGTSMSSPHAAGLAALAYQAGAANADEALKMLKAAAVRLPSPGAQEQGAGLIDAAKIGK
jgi:subtilisin